MNAALITVKIKKFINKFIVRFYKYIIVFSYLFKIPFLKFYLVRNIYIIDKSKENIWYLDYKRSTQEIDFLKTNKFNLLLTNILFIKELILFLDEKKKFHEYKKKFVFNLLNEIGIKLIISPAIHYKMNSIGYLGREFNIKFLVNHRECYNMSKFHLSGFGKHLSEKRNFFNKFDKLIVHNDIFKNLFIKYLKIDKKKIHIVGPIRFQNLKKIKKHKLKKNKIVFFGFTPVYSAWYDQNPDVDYYKKNFKFNPFGEIDYFLDNDLKYKNEIEKNIFYYKHFIESNLIFIKNSIKFPNLEFEIKLKWKDERWEYILKKIIKLKIGKFPSNLRITSDKNYWNKIMDSFLVCGYGSTTLLESSYLGVPSAQFVCGELDNKKTYHNRSRIIGHEKAFNILKTENDLTNLIIKKENLYDQSKIEFGRTKFFQYIANIDKDNLERKYKSIVKSLL